MILASVRIGPLSRGVRLCELEIAEEKMASRLAGSSWFCEIGGIAMDVEDHVTGDIVNL
jgi:hypothetical protein